MSVGGRENLDSPRGIKFQISRSDALLQRLSRASKLSTSFIDYAKRVLHVLGSVMSKASSREIK